MNRRPIAELVPRHTDIPSLLAAAREKRPADTPRLRVVSARYPHVIEDRVELRAAGNGVADLHLYGSIGGWFGKSADDVVAELQALGNVGQLRVHINSLGGDVFDGLAIYNTLRMFSGEVVTIVEGVAASIASIIALAGKSGVTMLEPSMFMIHEPHAIAFGNADDMREMAGLLDTAASLLADVYVARSKQPLEQIAAWMKAETWFKPAEALAAGFVDTVVPAEGGKPAPAPDPAEPTRPTPTPPPPPDDPEPASARATWRRDLAARELDLDLLVA